jgi:hypothetical protein
LLKSKTRFDIYQNDANQNALSGMTLSKMMLGSITLRKTIMNKYKNITLFIITLYDDTQQSVILRNDIQLWVIAEYRFAYF